MKNGDVEGALNAFNIAIKLFPSNPMLFMHRAAANLKFGNAIRAAQVNDSVLTFDWKIYKFLGCCSWIRNVHSASATEFTTTYPMSFTERPIPS